MSDFKCVTSTISTVKETLDKVQAILEDTYAQALEVQAALTDSGNWCGESQVVGAAFLDLVVQYHEKLAPESNSPISYARKGLYDYLERDAVFYEGWSEHTDIMSI